MAKTRSSFLKKKHLILGAIAALIFMLLIFATRTEGALLPTAENDFIWAFMR